MKKTKIFLISFFASLFIFCSLIFIWFYISFGIAPDSFENSVKDSTSSAVSSADYPSLNILAVYDGGDERYYARLKITPKVGSVAAEPLLLTENGGSADTVYTVDGINSLCSACSTADEKLKYVKFTSETFEKIADRYKGIVYNDDNGNKVLLTGRQAEAKLSPETFAEFCCLITESAIKNCNVSEFIYAAKTCENNLSYPEFYKLIKD